MGGTLSSHFDITATPDPDMFVHTNSDGKKCPYCTYIAFVQIDESALDAGGWLGGIRTLADTHDWEVDTNIPVPGSTTMDPTTARKGPTGTMGVIQFNDNPGGLDTSGLGWYMHNFSQAFEVHVMCLEGAERRCCVRWRRMGHLVVVHRRDRPRRLVFVPELRSAEQRADADFSTFSQHLVSRVPWTTLPDTKPPDTQVALTMPDQQHLCFIRQRGLSLSY